jgi:hypothetical protein
MRLEEKVNREMQQKMHMTPTVFAVIVTADETAYMLSNYPLGEQAIE